MWAPSLKQVRKEVVSLLYWSMLAACTIGPGTVVTCARAGFEQDLDLGWALVFASVMAYIMQVTVILHSLMNDVLGPGQWSPAQGPGLSRTCIWAGPWSSPPSWLTSCR